MATTAYVSHVGHIDQQQQQKQQHQKQHHQKRQKKQEKQQHQQQQQQQHRSDRRKKRKMKSGRGVIKNRKVGRWFLGETLGKGGYSWVKKGYDRKDGRVVALKFTSKAKGDWSASQSKQIQNEIEALRQIKDKHVLQLLAYNLNAKYPQKDGLIIPSVLLVLEYLPGGELFDILYYTSALNEDIARTYFIQLMDGMSACHESGICHRDIKPQNLLLDGNFQLKIADFGLAKVFEKDDDALMRTFYVGTRGYQSPEILKKKEYTVACDIFSCGVVLFILLAGYPPFEAATSKCRWYAPLANGNAREFWKQHRGCGIPGPAKDLITRMLWYDFNKRISIRGIRKHKWYNGKNLNSKELSNELRKLHRLMEIKRREDAEKQKQLQNSVKRAIDVCVKIYNKNYKPSDMDREIQELQGTDRSEYYNGDTIINVVDIYEASLIIESTKKSIDCISVLKECSLWDRDKNEICVNELILNIFNLATLKNNKYIKDLSNNLDEVYLELWYSDESKECIAPELPDNETITLKDIHTTYQPRYVLMYVQHCVLEYGGTATIDFKNASMEAHLATHNFPAPVTIQVRIFKDSQYECHLVKFERIGGDTLHFGRVLRQLIKQCGHVLTGLPPKYFEISDEDRALADEHFGDVFTNKN